MIVMVFKTLEQVDLIFTIGNENLLTPEPTWQLPK